VKLTTQPFDESAEPGQLIELLETVEGAEDLLCFATDYLHHDTDDPNDVARRLPESWWEKVFHRRLNRQNSSNSPDLAVTGDGLNRPRQMKQPGSRDDQVG
jgi:hypothetical protein